MVPQTDFESNAKVLAHLGRIAHLYFLLAAKDSGYYRRADAFMKALGSVKQLDTDIAEMVPALMTKHEKLAFVGPSTIGEIVDVLQRGTSDRLLKLEAEIGSQPQQAIETTSRTFVTDDGKIVWGS